jgi:hypothetical protein
VIVPCSRCGHEVESYGQHQGSVRRCFALLHEECPRQERNFYLDGSENGSQRASKDRGPSKEEEAYRRGYSEGHAAARENGDGGEFTVEQLRGLIKLCHPDVHPPERAQLANRVTARLITLMKQRRGDRA